MITIRLVIGMLQIDMHTSKCRGEAAAQVGNDPTGLMLEGSSYLHAQSRTRPEQELHFES